MAIDDRQPFNAKNVEIYVFDVDDESALLTKIGATYRNTNSVTLLGALDAAVTATDISNISKISDANNTLNVEPAENEVENRKHFGINSLGAQNVDTTINTNPDIDITFSQDLNIVDDLISYGLEVESVSGVEIGSSHAVSNYSSFNFGVESTKKLGILVRVAKQIGYIWYYRNYVFVDPKFSQIGGQDGSQDDTVFEYEYSVLANKSKGQIDFYASEPDVGSPTTPIPETSSNFN